MTDQLKSDDLATTLATFTNQELQPLYDILVAPLSGMLETEPRVIEAKPDHVQYPDLIARHLLKFGGNTLANIARGGDGPRYREVVRDVCASRRIKNTAALSAFDMESLLIEHMFSQLPKDEQDVIFEEAVKRYGHAGHGYAATMAAGAAFSAQVGGRMAGFMLYRTGLQLINGMSRLAIGRGLSLASNVAFTRTVGYALGPIGWAASSALFVKDAANPARRVTTPAVMRIAGTRRVKLWSLETGETS